MTLSTSRNFSDAYHTQSYANPDVNSVYSAPVHDISSHAHRVIIPEQNQSWRAGVTKRLEHLIGLKTGWDGYRAPAVDYGTTVFALRLLENICGHDCPAPDIVPGFSGDLQIEWHIEGLDIELHVQRANDVVAWRSKGDDIEGETLDLTNNFISILKWINELSSNVTQTAA
jgi:hypothetical protein